MIEGEFEFDPNRKIKIVDNSYFFAELHLRKEKVWLVWGNPNCTSHNETLIKRPVLHKIKHQIGAFLDENSSSDLPAD